MFSQYTAYGFGAKSGGGGGGGGITGNGTAGELALFFDETVIGSYRQLDFNDGNLNVSGNIFSVGRLWEVMSPNLDGTYQFTSICYGRGRFVATLANGGIAWTADGLFWQTEGVAPFLSWGKVTYGGGVFVAVSTETDYTNIIWSVDGVRWMAAEGISGDYGFATVGYGNGEFIAVGDGEDGVLAVSSDGRTWYEVSSYIPAGQWRDIVYAAGRWMICGSNTFTPTNGVLLSTSGPGGFSAIFVGPTNPWKTITYGEGKFVVLSDDGSGSVTKSDSGGFAWANSTISGHLLFQQVLFANGYFIALANRDPDLGGGGGAAIKHSKDGTNWYDSDMFYTNPENVWVGLAAGNGMIIAVAGNQISGSSDFVLRAGYPLALLNPTPANTMQKVRFSSDGVSTFYEIPHNLGRAANGVIVTPNNALSGTFSHAYPVGDYSFYIEFLVAPVMGENNLQFSFIVF